MLVALVFAASAHAAAPVFSGAQAAEVDEVGPTERLFGGLSLELDDLTEGQFPDRRYRYRGMSAFAGGRLTVGPLTGRLPRKHPRRWRGSPPGPHGRRASSASLRCPSGVPSMGAGEGEASLHPGVRPVPGRKRALSDPPGKVAPESP
jgi:hypothetical protein